MEKFKSLRKKNVFIDILTGLLFIAIIGIVAFFFLRKSEYIFVTVYINQTDALTYDIWGKPQPWYIEKIKPGIGEKDILGNESIKVEDVYRYDANGTDDTKSYYVILKMKSVYNKRSGQYSYNGIPLLIGGFQKLSIQEFQIKGIVRSISKTNEKPIQKLYHVTGFLDNNNNDFPSLRSTTFIYTSNGIPLSVSSNIKEDLRIIDTNGKTTVRITKVTKEPASYKLPINGQIMYAPDPERERVQIELEISATMIDDKPFYNQDFPLLINRVVPMSFPLFNLNLTITDLFPLDEQGK